MAKNSTEQISPPESLSLTRFRSYLCKMKGGKCSSHPKYSTVALSVTALGSFAGIGLVSLLATYYNLPLLLPSFGASAVLLYATCHVPMAQPRNLVGGHLISAFVGVSVFQLLGDVWWAVALGVSLAILTMAVTYTLHPPGGATAFVAVYTQQNFDFVISPVGLGAVCLLIIALLVNNVSCERKYPDYWF